MDSTSASLLVRLQQSEDREAWSRFVELYGPLIFHWARGTGMQESDAADLTQDVMALLLRKLPEFRYDPQKSFRSWLKTVTLNRWRETARRKSLPLLADGNRQLALVPGPSAEAFWEQEYRQQLIARTLETLAPEFRPSTWEAVRRYVLGNEAPETLASELGLSVWTIYSAKSRLLKRLRTELEGLLD